MAMGRGLTLQIEDGSYSLNSWNSIQPGRVKKSTETRQTHGKKLGGHFQLAVNFQKPKLPAKQLVTPASLMSSTLQPGQKSLSKDQPNFEDAAEDIFSEDEDSSQDEENDDDDESGDSGDQRKGAYNYRDSIPVLSDGGDGSSVNSSSDEEEYSSHAEEVKDAIESMEEIQREELGFTLLKDSNRPEDDSTRDKRKVVSLLGSMSPSSDKENLTDDTIVRVKGSDRNQSLRSTSSEQMATGLGRSDLHNLGNGQSKQPLTDSANTTIKTGNKPIISNGNAGRGSSQRSSLDRNKRNVDYTVTGIQRENLLISVPPKGGQWMSEEPMVGHHTPPEQELMFCGSKISQQSNRLSASAAPFVPQKRNDRIRERGPKSHSWIGLDNEATSWSSGFNIQEEHSDDAGGTGRGSIQGNDIGLTDDSLVSPEIGRHKPLDSLTTTSSNPTEYPQQGQGSSTGITGGALARSKFENARRGSPIQTDLKTSREGRPGFPEMTVNKPAIRNNSKPLSEMPTTSFTGVHGTGDRAGLAGRKVTTNACNNDKRISDSPGIPSGSDGVTITDPSSSQAITQHSRNEEASSSNRMKESKGQLGRTQAPVISEREAGQDVRRGSPSQDGGGGIVSTRIQPSGKLSDAERTNEYEWRKFKVVRKVKKVLKSAGDQAGKPHLPEDVTDQLLEIIIDMSDSFLVYEDKPQEVAIVLEEVILQAVEETAEDDDYQREFITLLQKLSSIIKNFERELKSALKLVKSKHIQAFTGAHTEKMGLSYCRFLGRLSFGFSVLPCPTKVMLEELISLLTNKWIIFNEKGTNPNAEVTEMSFAKCLKVLMKEIGPCYPEKKWKNLLEAVRGQIFGKRSQTVKEIFLEILLHSETLPRSSTAAELEVNRTNEPADSEDSSANKDTKEKDDPSQSNDGSKTEKERSSTSESGISEESPVIDVGKREPKSPSPTLSPYNDSMKAIYLSTKVRSSSQGRDHASNDDVKSQTMGSGIVERNKTAASDNREAFDWWDLETVNQVSGHLRKEKDKVRDDCISKQDNPERTKQGQHETKQGHHVPRRGHHVSKMDHQAPKEGHHVPEQVTREQQARESGSSANVKDEATEIWDEELITNPSPLMYPSALKRRMNENSLRGQRERFEINIGQATRTFEVCSGNDNNNVTMGRVSGAIIQADDDVIILEDSSDSDSETDEDVPLIWGDLNSTGHVQQQDHASNTPAGFQQNMQRGGGSAVSQTLVGQRNGEAGESLVVCQTPWSNQTLMVFQEEEDTECALSAVEIMAQRSLAERRRFGRGHLWHSANSTPWNEVNNKS